MSSRRRTLHFRLAAAAMAVFAMVYAAASPISSSADPGLGQLSSELGQQQARQQSLSASIGGLSQLIASLAGQIALVQSREAAVRAEEARDRVALAATHAARERELRLLALLRARLAHARVLLSRQLVSSYEGDRPDIVSVVLEAHGFADLLERISFLRDVERQQQTIIRVTKDAKARADSAARRLAKLEATDRRIAEQTAVRARALVGMDTLLESKQGALQSARSAQQGALEASRARGAELQAQIARVQAQQAAAQQAAASASGPASSGASAGSGGSASGSGPAGPSAPATGPALGASGGWVIPNPIVLCESGGQNLPPNGAGASGYYQITPSTWRMYGGTGSAAYLSGKAEQDAVAGRIWAGGAGASNWVCAGMVGIH